MKFETINELTNKREKVKRLRGKRATKKTAKKVSEIRKTVRDRMLKVFRKIYDGFFSALLYLSCRKSAKSLRKTSPSIRPFVHSFDRGACFWAT